MQDMSVQDSLIIRCMLTLIRVMKCLLALLANFTNSSFEKHTSNMDNKRSQGVLVTLAHKSNSTQMLPKRSQTGGSSLKLMRNLVKFIKMKHASNHVYYWK